MTIFVLGFGPITVQIYNDIISDGFNAKMVTNFAQNRKVISDSLTYAEFSLLSITKEDKVIIAWRSLGANLQDSEKRKMITYLSKNLKYANKVLYLSSGSIYGNAPHSFTETMVADPQTNYARAKFEIETWLRDTGNPATFICRISNVFGSPDLPNLIDKMLTCLERNEPLLLFDPKHFTRDYISLEAVSKSVRHFVHEYESHKPYLEFVNLSSNFPVTTATIIKFINEAVGYEISYEVIEIPSGVPVRNCLNNQKLLDVSKFKSIGSLVPIEDYIQLRVKKF